MEYKHIPVMLKEVIEYLDPKEGENFIDCTLGGGGYTAEILKKVGAKGSVLAFDADEMAIKNAKQKFKNKTNIKIIHENFKNLQTIINEASEKEIPKKQKADGYNGIVFDLGISSAQLEDRNRGLSFQLDAPLDMSFDQRAENTEHGTEYIVNKYKQEELEKIFKEYGEEKFSRSIAKKIVEARKEDEIKTTGQLVEIIRSAIPKRFQNSKIHPATKVFQALRIETNQELESLQEVLPQAVELLKEGGRLVIVSFHSLEDRIVKHFFKRESKACLCPPKQMICNCDHEAKIKIITKKIVVPTEEEVTINPRARSAKLRAAIRI